MKIGIPDDYADVVRTLSALKKLDGHEVRIWTDAERDVDTLAERFKDLDALVLLRERTKMPAALFKLLPNLKLISMNGGHPGLDREACTANGTLLCVGHGRTSYATAELTWGLVISAMRQIPQQVARVRRGEWQSEAGFVLRGKTLGVLGFGKIGAVVASFGKAFGMNVLVWSRERGLKAAQDAGYTPCPELPELFRRADVICLHVSFTPQTRGMVTPELLDMMKPAATIVNTSRAGLIAPGALVAALNKGRPGRAGIDVYETEPVGRTDPLTQMEQVVCTPHLGYLERDQLEAYFSDQFDRVLAFAAGKPVDVENPDALKVHKG